PSRAALLLSISLLLLFTDSATTDIYTLSLHDALPIFALHALEFGIAAPLRLGQAVAVHDHLVARLEFRIGRDDDGAGIDLAGPRSEEHTSELQSRENLVCRLLLEKKKIQQYSKQRLHT